jgi:anti-sigma regulatory factor (Ser/Thr protein kinase)
MALSHRQTSEFFYPTRSDLPAATVTQVRGQRAMKSSNGKGRTASRQFRADLLLKLEMTSNPEALCLVRATLERAAEALHFHSAERRAIVRSVDEALANVMRHAYEGKSGKPIVVTFRRLYGQKQPQSSAGIEVLLEDKGVALDPAKLKGRTLEDIRPGGLGLHFMRHSMDEVEFSRKHGKNQLRMVKYLAVPKTESGSEGE